MPGIYSFQITSGYVGSVHRLVGAVLNVHCLRLLGGLAFCVPCHASGNTVNGDFGHDSLELVAEVGCGDIRIGDICLFKRSLDGVYSVVSVSRKLIGSLVVVSSLVCRSELNGLVILCVCGERSKKHYAVCKGSVILELGDNSVESVAAEELDIETCGIRLLKYKRSLLIVNREEYKFGAAVLYLLKRN